MKELREQVAPLKAERLRLLREINRLTFEQAIAPDGDGAANSALAAMQQELDKLHNQIAPLQTEINQLTRQFWVKKDQVKSNKYDLSASRYRQIEEDEEFYEEPQVTLERLLRLQEVMTAQAKELENLL